MNTQLLPAHIKDKPLISNLLELYQHDMSEYHDSHMGLDGRYGYKYLDAYWEDPARQPFLIVANNQVAGFALVNSHLPKLTKEPGRAVAEFFVLRNYRRSGIGQQAARLIFDRYPGKWQVAQDSKNIPAQRFWETIVSKYTHQTYQKQIMNNDRWHGPVLLFEVKKEA